MLLRNAFISNIKVIFFLEIRYIFTNVKLFRILSTTNTSKSMSDLLLINNDIEYPYISAWTHLSIAHGLLPDTALDSWTLSQKRGDVWRKVCWPEDYICVSDWQ